jgi:2-polyprenyl-3-methyl-5-hydroxy-6-metoxy-1,4-benzoquinol methylase
VTQPAACPICGGATRQKLSGLYDDRYGYSGLFRMFQCRACGHLHTGGQFEPRHLTRLYTQFYPRSEFSLDDFRAHEELTGWRAWWNGERSAAFRWIPRDVRVLDVGCGFGQTLAYHQARGCEAYGCEVDENIQRVAERYGLKARVGAFNAQDYESGFFDYVTLDQVVEHSTAPLTLLKGIATILKPGGRAVLSTPNPQGLLAKCFGRRWMNWHIPYHLQFFTRRSMRLAATQAGLQLVKVRTITHSQWISYQWWHVLSRPPIGSPSAFWTAKATQPFAMARLGRFISLQQRLRINKLVTRMLDALGIGDNRLYFLQKRG